MRISLWIVVALLVVSGTPVAHADSFTATFTCVLSCTTPPTASDVTFPSPTFTVSFDGFTFPQIPLSSSDLPGDQYTWDAHPVLTPLGIINFFDITDVTTNTTSDGLAGGPIGVARFNGSLSFTPVTAPEPSSAALILAGIGLLLVMRKRIGQGLPQAS
jgi:hypothetical protein